MKQGSYKEELLSSIQEIKKRFKAVKQEAILCQGRMSRKIYDNSERALKTSQVFYELLLTSPAFRSQAQGNFAQLFHAHKTTLRRHNKRLLAHCKLLCLPS